MKKRLLSIFLIVSIIISVCIVGVTTTSAKTNTPSTPTLKLVIPINNGTMLCVRWEHNGKNTKNYRVWIHEHGQPITKWLHYDTDSSGEKYLVITKGLKPYKNYDVKVSAFGTNEKHSNYTKPIPAVNLNASINSKDKIISGNTVFIKLYLGNQAYNSGNTTENYYNVAEFITEGNTTQKRIIPTNLRDFRGVKMWNYPNVYGDSMKTDKFTKITYQVQLVTKYGKSKYTSGWSKAVTIS